MSFTLQCRKYGVAKNYALFGVHIFSLKIWLWERRKKSQVMCPCYLLLASYRLDFSPYITSPQLTIPYIRTVPLVSSKDLGLLMFPGCPLLGVSVCVREWKGWSICRKCDGGSLLQATGQGLGSRRSRRQDCMLDTPGE